MVELFSNSGGPDQTPRSAASDLGLHCWPVPVYGSPVFNGLNIHGFLLSAFKISSSYEARPLCIREDPCSPTPYRINLSINRENSDQT